jgi:acetylornithine deacetylase/succinyl-diaminopimelate desuccinylase-like protein
MKIEHKEALIKDLQTLIRFPSTLSEPVGDYPYGSAIGEALEWFLALGKGYGDRKSVV